MMEEASSVFKAVESCWNRAGKPQEFTVKILELPEKNFFGMTTKAAKVALFFNQVAPSPTAHVRQRPVRSSEAPRHAEKNEQLRRSETQRSQQRPLDTENRDNRRESYSNQSSDRRQDGRRDFRRDGGRQRQDYRQGQQRQEFRSDVQWTPEMIDAAQEWVKETLGMMNQSNINVITTAQGNFLKIELSGPVSQDGRQEEVLLKSWTNLIFEALRSRFKEQARGLRLVIESRK